MWYVLMYDFETSKNKRRGCATAQPHLVYKMYIVLVMLVSLKSKALGP